ncbi:MAG: histidinol dehydrogenase [Spirochaetales bacterium]|nr:histidinol dehydrogenase [Spirochaetales bacterium]
MIKIYEYGSVSDKEIFARTSSSQDVSGIVSPIIQDVRERGDQALRDYTRKFDGVDIDCIEVSESEIQEAYDSVDEAFISVLYKAAGNIRSYHLRQKRESFVISEKEGIVLGQKIVPVAVAGIYVPGGTAAYPSTVLMDTIPAKIAGVGQVVMVTPPGKDGKVSQAVLAAAKVAGVDRVFRVGGAQAIAALAYGTESIPKADKIVGPGNIFVA